MQTWIAAFAYIGWILKIYSIERNKRLLLIYCARSILHSSKLDHAWRLKRWLVTAKWRTTDRHTDRSTDRHRHDDFTNGNAIYHIRNQTEEGSQPPERFTVSTRFVFFPLAMQIQVNEYSFQRSPSIWALWHRFQWIMNVCGRIWCCVDVWTVNACYTVVCTNNISSLAIGMPHPIWHVGA